MTLTPGERWSKHALEDLRGARYRPAAWVRFLGDSFVRWLEVRRARPELARQAMRWSATGVLGAGTAREFIAARGLPAPRRAPALAWWAATAAMLDWHLGMAETLRGEARQLSIADALALIRAGLAPFAAAAAPDARLFLVVLGTGAATDLADGPLARRTGATRLGRDLDYAADVALLAAATSAARRAGWLPGAAARMIAARSAAPAVTFALGYFKDAHRPRTQHFGDAHWTAPLLYGGLAIAALGRPRAGGMLAGAASLGAVVSYASGSPARRVSPAAAGPLAQQARDRRGLGWVPVPARALRVGPLEWRLLGVVRPGRAGE
jgi:phosphatidylglycerophosphate synthase